MRSLLVLGLGLLALASPAQTNVQAVCEDGQTFVTFDEGANPPQYYEVYASTAPISLTSQGVRVGLPFRDEWRGKLLKDGSQDLIGVDLPWRIPDGNGGTRLLGAAEGLFVDTVRATRLRYFSIVPPGSAVILPSQQTAVPVLEVYDPIGGTVKPHFQFSVTVNGFQNAVFATWRMGDDDPEHHRPDFPVTANAAKNGMPYVFILAQPVGGPGPGPYPLSVALHGGQGHWWQFRPGFYPNIGNRITSGLMLGPADDVTHLKSGVQSHSMSKWFGFAENFDPVAIVFGQNPPAGTVVRNYTQRMIDWNIAYLMRPSTGLEIDPERVSVWGHSAGGRGASTYSRYRAGAVSACYMYTPAYEVAGEDQPNLLFGDRAAGLDSNLTVGGAPVKFFDCFDWDQRLNDAERDFPFTKVWSGKMEFDSGIGGNNHWTPSRIALFHAVNDAKLGFHIFWDSRDHAVPDWSTDDPLTAWNDIGEWIGPLPTDHSLRDDIQDEERFRLHQSYPAFYDSDEDPSTVGRQPDPGNGDPFDGAPWGTWSGYIDWDTGSILDTVKTWACTVWLVGQSPVAVDDYPGTALTASVAVRRPQNFKPTPGSLVQWTLRDLATGNVVQTGVSVVDAEGLVKATGLTLTKDPARRRIEMRTLPRPKAPKVG
ncbi:MAG: hypothetical protein JST30_15670 [Armatimonadetes bacterium]|nr:hypothetical protein [Armatimonadota bacterium]